MKHLKCGMVLVIAAAGLTACGGDPTESFQGQNEQIVADPGSIFLQQGANTFVTATLRDEQGNQLGSDMQVTNVGTGITVVVDSSFLQTTNGVALNIQHRFIVTGTTPGASSFTLSSGGVTQDIPVRVIPLDVAATFSNPTPAVNEALTITAPSGYKFGPNAGVTTDVGDGFVTGFSADSTAITVLLLPGSTGPVTLNGLNASFLPGLDLSLPTVDPITQAAQLPGTDATGTAPEIPVPALGASTLFLDGGAFTGADITGDGGAGAQYYKFVVTEAGDYHFVTDWPNDADLDAVVCFDAACNDGAFAGTGATQPEDGTLTLDPGTYYFAVVLFGGTAPPYFSLTLEHVTPDTGGGD